MEGDEKNMFLRDIFLAYWSSYIDLE